MQAEQKQSFFPHLCRRLQSLVWSCLDSDLTKTAVFYAERYFAMDPQNHESRHLYATALLRVGQKYSALSLVDIASDVQCTGCLEIKAKCCASLGRHRQAREALEATLQDLSYAASASSSSRMTRPFPEEAALRCRAGNMALKGNLPELASSSFKDALALDSYLWEAFEGLCALDTIPEIDEIFPPRAPPIKRTPSDEPPPKSAPGAGFLATDAGNVGFPFHAWKSDIPQAHPLRGAPVAGLRDIKAPNDPSLLSADNIFNHVGRVNRTQTNNSGPLLPQTSRPRSSAEEAGPVPKKLRSTSRQLEIAKPAQVNKPNVDDPVKKTVPASRAAGGLGKSIAQPTVGNIPIRRSTRLLSGSGLKAPYPAKNTQRDRRKPPSQVKALSAESDKDDERLVNDNAYSTSPPPSALSPGSEVSHSLSNWTSAQEQHAQEDYEMELADQYLYNLVRQFARATRALATYDCQKCLDELEMLPHVHQNSPWVLAMVGKAHYEKQDYASAERAFQAVRTLEAYRLWDMEVYSTLLWHLQRNVELSFLAQELLRIDPHAPQTWIAIGNLFSLQKERTQALTCFRRAAQLDPTCAYAFTLSGHESIDEDLDNAVNYFQTALRADPRHYNAWYGLGTCYLRMSKIRLAEYHYRRAVQIHPNNAVLLGCVGMAVERRNDHSAALALFNEAVRLDADNALVRYRRAKILVSMRQYQAAVDDLVYLRNTTPEESNVVFLLAKVYRLLGNEVKAAQTLAVARDISPKSLNKIKKLLETVRDEGDDRMDEG